MFLFLISLKINLYHFLLTFIVLSSSFGSSDSFLSTDITPLLGIISASSTIGFFLSIEITLVFGISSFFGFLSSSIGFSGSSFVILSSFDFLDSSMGFSGSSFVILSTFCFCVSSTGSSSLLSTAITGILGTASSFSVLGFFSSSISSS